MWPFKKKAPKPEPVVLTFVMKGEMADKFAVLYDEWRNRTGSSKSEARAMWTYVEKFLPEEHRSGDGTHEIQWDGVIPKIVTTKK